MCETEWRIVRLRGANGYVPCKADRLTEDIQYSADPSPQPQGAAAGQSHACHLPQNA
jgi:hypothetical protein